MITAQRGPAQHSFVSESETGAVPPTGLQHTDTDTQTDRRRRCGGRTGPGPLPSLTVQEHERAYACCGVDWSWPGELAWCVPRPDFGLRSCPVELVLLGNGETFGVRQRVSHVARIPPRGRARPTPRIAWGTSANQRCAARAGGGGGTKRLSRSARHALRCSGRGTPTSKSQDRTKQWRTVLPMAVQRFDPRGVLRSHPFPAQTTLCI